MQNVMSFLDKVSQQQNLNQEKTYKKIKSSVIQS